MSDIRRANVIADPNEMKDLYKEQETFYTAQGMVFEQFEFDMFWAEFAAKENDIIFHFFLPTLSEEVSTDSAFFQGYWSMYFPQILSEDSKFYFKAGTERLNGIYVPDMLSYWFKATGYVNQVLDYKQYAETFLNWLDGNLAAKMYPELRVLFVHAVGGKIPKQMSPLP